MAKYTIERILLALLTTFIILTLTFFLMYLMPFTLPLGTDTQKLAYYFHQVSLGYVEQYTSVQSGRAYLDVLTQNLSSGSVTYYFYRVSSWKQYCSWLTNILTRFDWGTSVKVQENASVTAIIGSRIWTTIKVNIWPVLISVPTGIGLGIWAALKKNKMTDHIISTLIMIFISVPSFVVITFLLLIFAYNTKWLPTKWPTPMEVSVNPSLGVKAYIIPTMALSFGSICGYCRFTRAELTEVMSSDFLLLARTKGLTKTQTITRHALKNAMVPILPSILAEVIGLLGGSMILEQIYQIPGVGKLYVDSISQADYNLLMADMAFYTVIGLLSGVFLDLSYGFIDPRIRMGAKK